MKNTFQDRQKELVDPPGRKLRNKRAYAMTETARDTLTYYGGKPGKDTVPKMEELTPREEKELWRIRKRSARARNLLVRRYIPWSFRFAAKYRNNRLGFDEAVSAANAGMMEAMETYSPRKGAHFTTYSALFIRRHLINALVGSYPVQLSDHLRKKFKDPTYGELQRKLGKASTLAELFEQITETPDFDFKLLFQQTEEAPFMPAVGNAPSDVCEDSMLPEELREGVVEALDGVEQKVIRARYYKQPPESFEKLGARLKITKIRAREHHDEALVKLRKYMTR